MMHILICIPSNNEYVHGRLMTTLINYFLKPDVNIKFNISLKTGSLITRIRNEYVSDFIHSTQFTHLLFIDSDLFDFEETLDLLLNSGKKLIGGIYRKKTSVEEYNVNLYDSIETTLDQGKYIQVKHIGTGLLLIERSVIYDLITTYPHTRYIHNNRAYFNLFACFIHNERYLSEDYGFCELYRSIGGKIYGVADSEMTHNGIMNYRGLFSEYLHKCLKR